MIYMYMLNLAGRGGVLKSIGNMGASILLRGGDGPPTPVGDNNKPISMADVVKQAAAGRCHFKYTIISRITCNAISSTNCSVWNHCDSVNCLIIFSVMIIPIS